MSISDRLQELISCKSDIKTAIEEKGVSVTGGLSTYADAVREIGGEWTPDNGLTFKYSLCTYIPKFNAVNITNMDEMFRDCTLLKSAPELETGHVTSMSMMFLHDDMLTTIPQYDTSSCTDMGGMMQNCRGLKSIPLLEAGNCNRITSILGASYVIADIGGFKDLGKAMWTWVPPNPYYGDPGYYLKMYTKYAFRQDVYITRESCLNIFNNLYDVRENPGGYIPELKFEPEVLDRLSEEDIAIATQKGWVIGIEDAGGILWPDE